MTQFETTCPNEHSVKFTLEMCGRTAQCPKCSARFEVPKLNEVRKMLGDEIDEDLEKEFKAAEQKLRELIKAKAAKRAQMEREAQEKAAREAREKAELEARKEEEAAEKKPTLEFEELSFAAETFAGTQKAKEEEKTGEEAVPEMNVEETSSEKEDSEKAEDEPAEEVSGDSSDEPADAEEADEPMIQFLCPNGHELSAPARMAGKKGRCPDCDARFIVPASEESEEAGTDVSVPETAESETAESEDSKTDSSQNPGSLKIQSPPPPPVSVSQNSEGRPFLYPNLAVGAGGSIDVGLEEAIQSIPEALRMDPMAKFFWALWNQEAEGENASGEASKDTLEEAAEESPISSKLIGKALKSSQSGKIEMHTADGKVFVPVAFYEDKSLSPIGFFEALDEQKRKITLVIRWDSIVRLTLVHD